MSSPSYLGFRPAPIWTILVGSSSLICTVLASSTPLKELEEAGMAGLVEGGGTQRHSSLCLGAAIVAIASSMSFYSQSSACWVLASTVMTSVGPDILSLR
jgi:hypothetical protein